MTIWVNLHQLQILVVLFAFGVVLAVGFSEFLRLVWDLRLKLGVASLGFGDALSLPGGGFRKAQQH
jgi:hypothetical protein